MPQRLLVATLAALMWAAAAGPAPGDELRYTARVFLDRARPDQAVDVFDLQVDAGRGRPERSRELVVRSAAGVFIVPFFALRAVEFLRHLGTDGDLVRYQAQVTHRDGSARDGVIELRALAGTASGSPWRVLLAALVDRGAGPHRIEFERGSAPNPGSVACGDPCAPRRSLAGARCAPPLCGNEPGHLLMSRITALAE